MALGYTFNTSAMQVTTGSTGPAGGFIYGPTGTTGPSGPHTTGYAVDIHVSNSQHRKQLIDYFATKVTGLGVAKTFLHIDLLTPEHGFDMTPNAWKY